MRALLVIVLCLIFSDKAFACISNSSSENRIESDSISDIFKCGYDADPESIKLFDSIDVQWKQDRDEQIRAGGDKNGQWEQIANLNITALGIWQQMLQCARVDIQVKKSRQSPFELARRRYFEARNFCENNKQQDRKVAQELKELHSNLNNIFSSFEFKQSSTRSRLAYGTPPNFHPLLAQVVLESLVTHIKVKGIDSERSKVEVDEMHRIFGLPRRRKVLNSDQFIKQWSLALTELNNRVRNRGLPRLKSYQHMEDYFNRRLTNPPVAAKKHFELNQNIRQISNSAILAILNPMLNCQSFGLWPHSTQYIFYNLLHNSYDRVFFRKQFDYLSEKFDRSCGAYPKHSGVFNGLNDSDTNDLIENYRDIWFRYTKDDSARSSFSTDDRAIDFTESSESD